MEETKKVANEELESEVKKKMEKENNKTFIKVLLVLGLFIAFFAAWLIISYNQARFDYRGVAFEHVDEIAPYRTSIPVNLANIDSTITGGAVGIRDYYFYLRADPRKTDKIPFEGELVIPKVLAFNTTGNFNCQGRGVIGVTNLARLYGAMGTIVTKDENATCSDDGSFILIQMEEGNETKIIQTGPTCYTMKIANCEALEVTERYMIETFVKLKELS